MSNESNKMSNESKKKEDTLPGETKGKIEDIRKDPEIEKKRRERQLEWAKTGLANLKHGRYSRLSLLFPDRDHALKVLGEGEIKEQYKKIIESLKGFDIQDEAHLVSMLNDLLRVDLIRAAKNIIYEAMSGGLQDKALSLLISNISARMIAILSLKKKPVEIKNYFFQMAEQIRNEFSEDKRLELIKALQETEEAQAVDVKENQTNSQGIES